MTRLAQATQSRASRAGEAVPHLCRARLTALFSAALVLSAAPVWAQTGTAGDPEEDDAFERMLNEMDEQDALDSVALGDFEGGEVEEEQEWDEVAAEDSFAAEAEDAHEGHAHGPDDDAHDEGAHDEGAHEHGEGGHPHPPGAAHDAHGEEHGPSISGFFAGLVNFIIWLAIVIALARKPLSEFLRNRRHTITEGLDEAKRLTEAAEAKYALYSDKLDHLDEELERLRGEMTAAGKAEADRIVAEAQEKAARIRRDTKFVIDQRVKQLRVDLTKEAVEAAINAAETVLTEQVRGPDQQRLAEEYLNEIETSFKEEVRA